MTAMRPDLLHFRLIRRFRYDERGATLVEASLLIPFVFVFMFGAVEFLFAFHQWNRAVKAVERGARIVRVHDVRETVQALAVWRQARKYY